MRQSYRTGPDSYVEVTHQGFGQRMAGSLCGVVMGWLFLLAAPAVLWLNEQNAVATAHELDFLSNNVVPLGHRPTKAAALNYAGRPVHFTEDVRGAQLTDDAGPYSLTVKAAKLSRTVDMYQWVEHVRSTTQKNVGGSSTTTKHYDYTTEWRSGYSNSASFHVPAGHENPRPAVSSHSLSAPAIMLGDLTPSREVVEALPVTRLAVTPDMLRTTDRQVAARGGQVHLGTDAYPRVGDLRVTYRHCPDGQAVSVMGVMQADGTVTGAPKSVLPLVSGGTQASDALLAERAALNVAMLWVLRLVGFVLMWVGLSVCIDPINTAADLVPFVGSLVRWVTGTAVFAVAAALTLVVVACAWLFARPLLSAMILCVAASAVFFARAAGPTQKHNRD